MKAEASASALSALKILFVSMHPTLAHRQLTRRRRPSRDKQHPRRAAPAPAQSQGRYLIAAASLPLPASSNFLSRSARYLWKSVSVFQPRIRSSSPRSKPATTVARVESSAVDRFFASVGEMNRSSLRHRAESLRPLEMDPATLLISVVPVVLCLRERQIWRSLSATDLVARHASSRASPPLYR